MPGAFVGRGTDDGRERAELSVGERAVVRGVTATFGTLNLPAGEQDDGRVLAVHASGRCE
jgi:hypothetical protein